MLSRVLFLSVTNDFLAVDPLTDPNKVYYSPGVVGFIAVFLMMVAATFLIIDMVRRVRRVRYRQEIQEKLASETAAKGRKANK
jgi:C4-dicarboxylate-specific signal transduction histidine kinase